MTEGHGVDIERVATAHAAAFVYPETPGIADAVEHELARPGPRRFGGIARFATVAVVLVAVLMAIPPVRSAVIEWIRVGVVSLFRDRPEGVDGDQPPQIDWIRMAASSVSLEEAERATSYRIKLPRGFPDPDECFLQSQADGSTNTYLVWKDRDGKAHTALYFLETGFSKHGVVLAETQVHEGWAIWVDGPHLLNVQEGQYQAWHFVEGNVLLWQADGITYRLETLEPLEKARAIAESLRPFTPVEEE